MTEGERIREVPCFSNQFGTPPLCYDANSPERTSMRDKHNLASHSQSSVSSDKKPSSWCTNMKECHDTRTLLHIAHTLTALPMHWSARIWDTPTHKGCENCNCPLFINSYRSLFISLIRTRSNGMCNRSPSSHALCPFPMFRTASSCSMADLDSLKQHCLVISPWSRTV